MLVRLTIFSVGVVSLLFVGSPVSAALININDAFYANETPEPGAEANPFPGPDGSTITLGYNLTPSTPSTFLTTGLVHTDTFNGVANVEGFYVPNNASVPAALINTGGDGKTTNFGVTFATDRQILLHPGNPGGDAFTQQASAAVLRYTVGTTGTYNVAGDFSSLSTGAVNVDILLNGVSILSSGAGSDATTFSEVKAMNSGDFLDFVVDDGGDIGSDSTGLRANVALVPEPASIVLLTIVGCGLVSRRRSA